MEIRTTLVVAAHKVICWKSASYYCWASRKSRRTRHPYPIVSGEAGAALVSNQSAMFKFLHGASHYFHHCMSHWIQMDLQQCRGFCLFVCGVKLCSCSLFFPTLSFGNYCDSTKGSLCSSSLPAPTTEHSWKRKAEAASLLQSGGGTGDALAALCRYTAVQSEGSITLCSGASS